ncbi:MAG: hypothetical protein LBD80_08170 [Tannerella sp.]|jgi:beta-glucanase (GH16 family)|nr:hypothetical protein [Tannerella sp.]
MNVKYYYILIAIFVLLGEGCMSNEVDVISLEEYSLVWSDEFKWMPDFIRGYVDKGTYIEFFNNWKGNKETWPFDHPFYLKLNLAWGGSWGDIQGVDESCLPAVYEIDNVRVYQKQ